MWRCRWTSFVVAILMTSSIDGFVLSEAIDASNRRATGYESNGTVEDVGELLGTKREVQTSSVSSVCDLHIIGDFRWYRHVAHRNRTYGAELVNSLLLVVDQIFRSLGTDGDGVPNGMGFAVRNFVIDERPARAEYDVLEQWNPKRFFDEFRLHDFGGVCAGLLLTFRPLSYDARRPGMPTIPKTNIGGGLDQGVCSRSLPPLPRSDGPTGLLPDYGAYVTNALPVNFMSPDRRVASHLAMVIQTAHQLGHLFGARDDADLKDDPRCRPVTDVGRNYIMGYPLVSGLAERNYRWSPCSREAIAGFVLGLRSRGRFCLRSCSTPTCLKVVARGDPRQKYVRPVREPAGDDEKKGDGETETTATGGSTDLCDVETTLYSERYGSSGTSASLHVGVRLLAAAVWARILLRTA